jgi:hypothetical protein
MSFENAPQSHCGAFSKGGKGSDATTPEKFLKELYSERKVF